METKPKTNADRIRAMTDEELAEFLAKRYILCVRCFFRRTSGRNTRMWSGNTPDMTTESGLPCGI